MNTIDVLSKHREIPIRYFPMFAQNIDCVHVNDLPYFRGITYLPLLFHFGLFLFNVPVNNFTVMSGRSNRFLGSEIMVCLISLSDFKHW